MNKGIWVAAAAAGVLAVPAVASAQEAPRGNFFNRPVLAPSSALEIGVNGGYNQGFGDITPGTRVQDLTGAGGAVGLDVGYRATPHLMVGTYGQYSQFGSDVAGSNIRDFTAGIEGNVHFAPYTGMDPWVGLGTGYHGFWVDPNNGPATNLSGWEIARVRVGADFRASNEVALGPMVGGSANIFLTEKLPGDASFHNVPSPRVNATIFAGINGRFDLAGTSVRPASNVAGR
jgi:hypothetical protein